MVLAQPTQEPEEPEADQEVRDPDGPDV